MSHIDRPSFLEVTLGGTLALTLPTPSLAQGRKLGKIEYGVASVDAIYATPYVALKKNFFEAEGLEVAYLNSQSGPRSKQMQAAQQLFVTTTGANDSVAPSRSRGRPRCWSSGSTTASASPTSSSTRSCTTPARCESSRIWRGRRWR